MRTCDIEGCSNKHEAKNFCKKHYRSFLRYGDALYVERKKLEKEKAKQERKKSHEQTKKRHSREGTCNIKGCSKRITSRGLCSTHYNRLQRNGHLEVKHIFNQVKTDKCLAINCDNVHKRHGLCSTHLMNVRELKTPYRPKIVKLCGAKDCNEAHYGWGLCKNHLYEWKRVVKLNELSKYLDLKGH